MRRKVWRLEELVAGITPSNIHGEISWGRRAGREARKASRICRLPDEITADVLGKLQSLLARNQQA